MVEKSSLSEIAIHEYKKWKIDIIIFSGLRKGPKKRIRKDEHGWLCLLNEWGYIQFIAGYLYRGTVEVVIK